MVVYNGAVKIIFGETKSKNLKITGRGLNVLLYKL